MIIEKIKDLVSIARLKFNLDNQPFINLNTNDRMFVLHIECPGYFNYFLKSENNMMTNNKVVRYKYRMLIYYHEVCMIKHIESKTEGELFSIYSPIEHPYTGSVNYETVVYQIPIERLEAALERCLYRSQRREINKYLSELILNNF